METELPLETERLLQGIYNQPDHTIQIQDARKLPFKDCESRLRVLLKEKLIRQTNYDGMFPTCYTVTTLGADYLSRQKSLKETIRELEERLSRAEDKAEMYKRQYEELKKSHRIREVIVGSVTSLLGGLIGNLLK